jgi:hypothetical protein
MPDASYFDNHPSDILAGHMRQFVRRSPGAAVSVFVAELVALLGGDKAGAIETVLDAAQALPEPAAPIAKP